MARDDECALYLERTGMASAKQISEVRGKHRKLSLLDALLQEGVITDDQRQAVEKKIEGKKVRKLGSYRLLKKLGAGGMGEVFLAENTLTQEKAALKVLPSKHALSPHALERFIREATEASKLVHPRIVRALTAGEEQGIYYYVMEYCEGTSLARQLETSGALPPDVATKTILKIAEGLGYAHERGIIHRDIKPDNLILTSSGEPKILDLGLAKNLREEMQPQLTAEGETIGTPYYMPPEQARGDSDIDRRADIYALGATYFHLVTGRPPFSGSTAFEIISRHLTEPIPDPSAIRRGIPESVSAVIRKMMAKKPEDRFQNCGEVIAALKGRAKPRPKPAPTRSKVPFIVGGAVGLAVVVIVAIVLLSGREKAETKPVPEPATKPRTERREDGPKWGTPVNLLRTAEPNRDSKNGVWRFEDGVLVSEAGGDNTDTGAVRLGIRMTPPREYDLEITARRMDGFEDLLVVFPFQDRPVAIYFDGWFGKSSGLWEDNRWARHGPAVMAGGEKKIVISVRKMSLRVAVDGRELYRRTDLALLGAPSYVRVGNRELVIGAIRSVYRIRRIILKPISR